MPSALLMAEESYTMGDCDENVQTQDEWLAPRLFRAVALLVIALAALVRFQGLDWDQGAHLHPDERYLTMVVSAVRFPHEGLGTDAVDGTSTPPCSGFWSCLARYWDTAESSLNPANYDAYASYVYGTLPLFTTRAVASWLDASCGGLGGLLSSTLHTCTPGHYLGYDGIYLVGRALSGVMDLVTLIGLIWLGRSLYGRLTGLLAGALYAFAVLPVQHAHFFVVDSFATVFVVWALLFCVLAVQRNDRWLLLLAGAFTGLAVASKASVWPLAGIVALAALRLSLWKPSRTGLPVPDRPTVPNRPLANTFAALILSGIVAALAFRVTQPYAFTGPGFFDVEINPKWLAAMREVQELMGGLRDVPYGHQWTARLPVIFPGYNLVIWGLGLPLGIAASMGWGWMGWDLAVRRRTVHLLPWVWGTAFFLYQATQWVKSMRYLLPIYPVLALLAAWWAVRLASRAAHGRPYAGRTGRIIRVLALSVPYVLLAGTVVWCLSFTAIYRSPVTRVEASHWIFENVPTAVTLRTSDGESINAPLAPGTVLSAAQGDGTEVNVTLPHDASIAAVVLPKVSGRGQSGIRTLVASLLSDQASDSFVLPDDSTALVTLEFDEPVPVKSGAPVVLGLALSAGPDIALETSVIANEHWDDPLPLRMDGKDPFWDWYQGLDSSSSGQLNLYDPDTVEKRLNLLSWLNEADYIVLSSNRLYASIPRLPGRYPLTTEYYRALFDGSLGFELLAEFVSYPSLGVCQFPDQENPFTASAPVHTNARACNVVLPPAEEAFSVYDHPTVLIFKKTPEYSRAIVQTILPRSLTDSAVFVMPRQATGSGQEDESLLSTPRLREEQEAGGTWSRIFDREALLNRFPGFGAVVWMLTVTLLGWIAFPMLALLLPDLRHGGYGLARVVGLLIWSYCSWLLASLHLVPQTRFSLWLLLLLFGVCSVRVAYRHRVHLSALIAAKWRDIVITDVLFIGLFLVWVGVRWMNPDLWHPAMGGEKPMDFAYFNAIIKSTWFPPYDPWFAGGTINYYYFGFVMVGSLTEALGIVPSVAYNLVVPTLYALTGVGAYTLANNLAKGDDRRGRHAGIWAVLLVLVLGNLGEVQLLVNGFRQVGNIRFESLIPGYPEIVSVAVGIWKVLFQGARLPFRPEWPYWNPTRIIPIGPQELVVPITEFPAFTFLYADLHAHMMALPLTQIALAVALQWSLGAANARARRLAAPGWLRWPRIAALLPTPAASLLLAGLVGGALRATNTWDYPTYLVVMGVGFVLGLTTRPLDDVVIETETSHPVGMRSPLWTWLLPGLTTLLLLVGCAELLFRPFTANYRGAYAAVEWWKGSRTPLPTYLLMYGQFLFPIVAGGIATLVGTLRHRRQPSTPGGLLWPIVLFLTAMVAGILLVEYLEIRIAWLAVPLGVLAAVLVIRPGDDVRQRVLWFWVGSALALSLMVEAVVLKGDLERMNTVFKFHLQVWMLLAVSSSVFVERIVQGRRLWIPEPSEEPRDAGTSSIRAASGDAVAPLIPSPSAVRRPGGVGWRNLMALAMVLLLFCAGLYPACAIPAKLSDRWVPTAPFTLDGMAYIASATQYERDTAIPLVADILVIRWLQDNVVGSPTIIEAQADHEYLWGNRISIYTGLPSVAGWRWHQVQQRQVMPAGTVEARQQDVRTFYNTESPDLAQTILERYAVRYVILTPYERAYMEDAGMLKFAPMVESGVLEVAYEDSMSVIYRVTDG